MPVKRNPDKAVAAMQDQAPRSLEELNRIIAASEPLVPGATRAVLGEGPVGAAIAFVGEQPGDQEDLQGRPFVGPAGQLLDRALEEAGIDRASVYLTNAVKHFKFVRRGTRRIHESPTAGEVKHYRWWLERELDLVRPASSWRWARRPRWRSPARRCPSAATAGPSASARGRATSPSTPPRCCASPIRRRGRRGFRAYCEDMRRIRDLAAA